MNVMRHGNSLTYNGKKVENVIFACIDGIISSLEGSFANGHGAWCLLHLWAGLAKTTGILVSDLVLCHKWIHRRQGSVEEEFKQ
jgi:hypothetical protein